MISRNILGRSYRPLRVPRATRQKASGLQWRSSRRGYASASETASKAKEGAKHTAQKLQSSELPWIIGATAITIPSTYLILANGSWGEEKGYPGEKYHGGEHGEEHEEGEEEEGEGEGESAEGEEKEEGGEEKEEGGEEKEDGGDEKQDGGDEEKAEGGEEEKSGDDDSALDGGEEKQEEGGDDKQEEGDQDPSEKGGRVDPQRGADYKRAEGKNTPDEPKEDKITKKTKSGEEAKFTEEVELDNGDSDSKKIHKPDAKGGAKRRIESSNAIPQKSLNEDDSQAAAGTEPKRGQIVSKQYGLSNTDTKHSFDFENNERMPKKSDGSGPDTAKAKGTVDPGRSTRPTKERDE